MINFQGKQVTDFHRKLTRTLHKLEELCIASGGDLISIENGNRVNQVAWKQNADAAASSLLTKIAFLRNSLKLRANVRAQAER
jgi:hypothetical protein